MQVAVRSYLTAGVALVGAGAIALMPITPLPDLADAEAGTVATVYANYTPTALASAFVDEDQAQIAKIASVLVGSPNAAAVLAALALPTPSELALAVGQLIVGHSQAFDIGVGGIADGINAGLTGLQNITIIAGTSVQGINDALTTAFARSPGTAQPTTTAPNSSSRPTSSEGTGTPEGAANCVTSREHRRYGRHAEHLRRDQGRRQHQGWDQRRRQHQG